MTTSERPTSDAPERIWICHAPAGVVSSGPEVTSDRYVDLWRDRGWNCEAWYRAWNCEVWYRASAPASPAIGIQAVTDAAQFLLSRLRHFSDAPSDSQSDDRWHFSVLPAMRMLEAALHPAPEAASASILAGGVREALEDVCRCKNTITAGPCIVCGRPKLVTKEWFERKAALENDHEIGAGSMEDRLVIVPRKPRAVQLEQAASNLADEFGADFVLENKRFALAVYDEMLSAGAVKSLSEEMRDRAFEAASAAVPASVDIGRGELDRIVNAALATLSLPDVGATDTAPSPKGVSDGAQDVLAERRRQIEAEGWTPEHDDEHTRGEIAAAAVCYAFTAVKSPHHINNLIWPWPSYWWKPTDKRRNLVKAGALILAEIERLDRADQQQESQ